MIVFLTILILYSLWAWWFTWTWAMKEQSQISFGEACLITCMAGLFAPMILWEEYQHKPVWKAKNDNLKKD